MLDALAWGMEAAFFSYPRMEKLRLPEEARSKGFADPHENRVIEICQKAGFKAGQVTKSGVWKTQQGNMQLIAPRGLPCPGQIDCVALSPDHQTALVLECKVLWLPHTYRTLRNAIDKLSTADKESFHTNLTRKAEWIKTALSVRHIRTGLVVDRAVPLKEHTPNPIILISELNNFLSN